MSGRMKSFASDTMIYGGFTIIGRFLTFLLTPLYSNYMTASEVGDIQNINAVFAFLLIIYSFGMESAYFRFYDKNDLIKSQKVYSHSFIFMLIGSLIFSGIFWGLSDYMYPSFFTLPNAKQLYNISIIIPLTDILMFVPYCYLRMARKARTFAILKFIVIVTTVVLNYVLLVEYSMGAMGVLLAQVIANSLGVLMFIPNVFTNLRLNFDKALFKDMFYFGLPTVPASFSQIILQLADRPILKYLKGPAEAGMYGINYRLGIPMMMFVSVFEYAWKPFYLSHYKDSDAKTLFSRIFTYFTLICALVFLVTSLFISDLVKMPFIGGRFIKPDYWGGMFIIPIVLVAYYFNGAFNNFAAGLQITKNTKYFPIAVSIAAIVNIGLNFAFIPTYGYQAAAWTTLIAYLISALVLYYFSQKVYPIKYEWSRLIQILLISAIIYLPVHYLTSGLSIVPALSIKLLSLVFFVFILKLIGFFTIAEIKQIKRLFIRH